MRLLVKYPQLTLWALVANERIEYEGIFIEWLTSNLKMIFKKRGVIIFLLILILIYLSGNHFSKRAKRIALEIDIVGIIEDIEYDQKQVPTIYVKGKDFYLYEFGVRKDDAFKKGDSISKKKGSFILKYFKKYPNGFYPSRTFEMND